MAFHSGKMTKKTYANLLLFALLGITLWFFGNLYEGIVITPNLLIDPIGKMYNWQKFFTVTNPIFFYIPLVPIAVLTTIVLYFKTPKEKIVLKRHLKYAAIFLIFALGVGIFIITQINFRLFFGNIEKISGEIYKLAVLWNLLNIVRVILLAFTIYHVFKAYIFIQNTS
jgi:hypothetical protein